MDSSVNETAENLPERISGWSELSKLVEHFSYFAGHAWLFRGTTDATHKLIPKIGRETARAEKLNARTQDKSRIPYRRQDERAIFDMFKQQARAHLSSPPRSNLEWLAIAQHFGLPTRLLDWTDSLLVAPGLPLKKAVQGLWILPFGYQRERALLKWITQAKF